jgi:aminodeoxyfutalosine synthase
MPTLSPPLQTIADKLDAHECLTHADGLLLWQAPLLEVGWLANREKERRHGRRVTYIINRHLNPTNVCTLRCPLCAFSRGAGEPEAFTRTVDELLQMAEAYRSPDLAEFHIVGGLNPDLPFAYACELLSRLRAAFPGVALKAFTAVEIAHWAQGGGMSTAACLARLTDAGLSGLTGGGAEIFAPRVRARICPGKLSGEAWLALHGEAHALGLPTTATMLYGHIETPDERVAHLLALRAQQARSGGFLAFISLAYHPGNTALGGLPTTGQDDMRTLAIARLLLDNIPHIKAYWVMLGVKMAQVALAFGANDVDGTVQEERICHMAGGQTPQGLPEAALRALIAAAGGEPLRRDSWHRPLPAEEPACPPSA